MGKLLDVFKNIFEKCAYKYKAVMLSTLLIFEKNSNIFQILWGGGAQFIKIIMYQHGQFKAMFLFNLMQKIAKWYDPKILFWVIPP